MDPRTQDKPLYLVHPRVVRDLDFARIQQAISERAQTDIGRARSAALPLLPSTHAVRERLLTLGELMAAHLDTHSWPSLGGVSDVGDACTLAERGSTLEPVKLMGIAR